MTTWYRYYTSLFRIIASDRVFELTTNHIVSGLFTADMEFCLVVFNYLVFYSLLFFR